MPNVDREPNGDDMANAVRTVARHSQDPKEVHWKAARKILEYLHARAHLGLTFHMDLV